MTDAELEAIEAACLAATPGPWTREEPGVRGPWPHESAEVDGPWLGYTGDFKVPDATFIAGARSWVPALVEEVRRLRADLRELYDARSAREKQYEEDVEETNRLLDAAGMHIGSSDLSTLVGILIKDADNGRTATASARVEGRLAGLHEAAEALKEINFQSGVWGTAMTDRMLEHVKQVCIEAIEARARGQG